MRCARSMIERAPGDRREGFHRADRRGRHRLPVAGGQQRRGVLDPARRAPPGVVRCPADRRRRLLLPGLHRARHHLQHGGRIPDGTAARRVRRGFFSISRGKPPASTRSSGCCSKSPGRHWRTRASNPQSIPRHPDRRLHQPDHQRLLPLGGPASCAASRSTPTFRSATPPASPPAGCPTSSVRRGRWCWTPRARRRWCPSTWRARGLRRRNRHRAGRRGEPDSESGEQHRLLAVRDAVPGRLVASPSTPTPTATCAARAAASWCSSASRTRNGQRHRAGRGARVGGQPGQRQQRARPSPTGPAQQALMRQALHAARLAPSDIDYVGARHRHRTGRPHRTRRAGRGLRQQDGSAPLVLGSVKTSLGHLESAAGVTGFIKTVLSVARGHPKRLRFTKLTPHAGRARRVCHRRRSLRVARCQPSAPGGRVPRSASAAPTPTSSSNGPRSPSWCRPRPEAPVSTPGAERRSPGDRRDGRPAGRLAGRTGQRRHRHGGRRAHPEPPPGPASAVRHRHRVRPPSGSRGGCAPLAGGYRLRA